MTKDTHLKTGRYKPIRYWEERAKSSEGDTYKAVCVFGISTAENSAMEKIQLATLNSILRTTTLDKAKVLEIGCGVGRWAPFFLKRGASYIGVDISKSMLEIARARTPQAKFKQINSAQLPFADNEFDLVSSITVLHHNSYEEQQAIIDEMVRVTKPNNFIVLMEAIGVKDERTSFNMFPRSIDGWIAEIEKDGRAQLVSMKLTRWWIIRDVVFKLLRSLGVPEDKRKNMKTLNRFLVMSGRYIDKHLLYILPKKFTTNTAMLFKKR